MARRTTFGFVSVLLALATPALAAPTPPGVNLRWDQCYSDGGVINRTFACDTNAGSDRLVMSFVLDSEMLDVTGMETRVFIESASPALPSWWSMRNAGTCRLASLSLGTTLPPGALNCVDWANGNAVGGIGNYVIGELGPNSVVINAACAVSPENLATLAAGQEYFVGSLTINHAKTVGTGSCAGCDVPVCIVFDRLRVTTPVLANNRTLQGGANGPDSQFARWQNGQETNVTIVFSGPNFGFYHSYTCELSATPTRGSTWGAVKSLYR
jgi:hypothetical protein